MISLEKIVENSTGETKEVLNNFVHSFAETIQERNQLRQKIDILSHELRLMKKRLFGSRSEKIMSTDIALQSDIPLFNEFELTAQEVTPHEPLPMDEAVTSKPAAKKPGRKPLPASLPRTVIEHDLTAEEKQCPCGAAMECIGTQVSEELEYIPAKVQVIEHRCKKFLCTACAKAQQDNPAQTVPSKTAAKPAQLIEKSIASPSLLAHIAVSKFNDHLPLYRQEAIFQRLDIDLSRQTMSQWMLHCGEAVIPLINLLQDSILAYDIAYTDETTVQVLNEPGRRAQTKSYMWCFIGGPPDQRALIYQYHPTRGGEVADQFFADYTGALHSDAYAGYNTLLASPRIIGLGCWAHVRRKFVEALPNGQEKGVSGQVVKRIRVLYHLEEMLRLQNADVDTIHRIRQEQAAPLLAELHALLLDRAPLVPPKSAIGKAIQYALNRWPYLTTYLQDGRYEIDNNRTERGIKPFAVGRKNWLFANSVAGAHASAHLFSLIETAKIHQLNPLTYLTDVFRMLPNCRVLEDYEALLPWHQPGAFFKTSK